MHKFIEEVWKRSLIKVKTTTRLNKQICPNINDSEIESIYASPNKSTTKSFKVPDALWWTPQQNCILAILTLAYWALQEYNVTLSCCVSSKTVWSNKFILQQQWCWPKSFHLFCEITKIFTLMKFVFVTAEQRERNLQVEKMFPIQRQLNWWWSISNLLLSRAPIGKMA